ncbi:MAG: hypothetical protein LZF63_13700, partial [Nitrosomonas sp.]|nr:hypothetical protein [Nitrosomonas sp.]
IGEPEEDHDIVLNKCRNAPGAMTYFLKHANGVGAGRFFGCFELSTAPSPNFHTHKKGIS